MRATRHYVLRGGLASGKAPAFIIAFGALFSACTSDGGEEDVVEDPLVHVKLAKLDGVPFWRSNISFFNPDGTGVPAVEEAQYEWGARVQAGGNVRAFYELGGSPSSLSTSTVEINGVRPGDRFDIRGPEQPVPEGCECRLIADLVSTSTGTTWTDPDAGRVVARIIGKGFFGGSGPFPRHSSSLMIDGSSETSTPITIFGAGAGWSLSVAVVRCDSLRYDDVRGGAQHFRCRL